MSLDIFWQVFSITFGMLFAIGPICLTVINTTILNGFWCGLFAGFGVSVADTIYILIATFLLELAKKFLSSKYIFLLVIFSSILLINIAYKFWFYKIDSIDKKNKVTSKSKLKIFLYLFTLTITGPTTIVTYAVIFSNFTNYNFKPLLIVSGAVSATFSFYIILVSILSIFRKKFNNKIIRILNKISSIIILIFVILIIKNTLL